MKSVLEFHVLGVGKWSWHSCGCYFDMNNNLPIVTDHLFPFMARVFPDGSGLFQQNNTPCHTAKWFEEHDEFKL